MDTDGAITAAVVITTVGAAAVTMAGTEAIITVGAIIVIAIGGDVPIEEERPQQSAASFTSTASLRPPATEAVCWMLAQGLHRPGFAHPLLWKQKLMLTKPNRALVLTRRRMVDSKYYRLSWL